MVFEMVWRAVPGVPVFFIFYKWLRLSMFLRNVGCVKSSCGLKRGYCHGFSASYDIDFNYAYYYEAT